MKRRDRHSEQWSLWYSFDETFMVVNLWSVVYIHKTGIGLHGWNSMTDIHHMMAKCWRITPWGNLKQCFLIVLIHLVTCSLNGVNSSCDKCWCHQHQPKAAIWLVFFHFYTKKLPQHSWLSNLHQQKWVCRCSFPNTLILGFDNGWYLFGTKPLGWAA